MEQDPIQYDKRNVALLLDRGRIDLLAFISPDGVEPFSKYYEEIQALAAIEPPPGMPRLGQRMHVWADRNLLYSAARNGARSEAVENVLTSLADPKDKGGENLEGTPGRGLKGRGE